MSTVLINPTLVGINQHPLPSLEIISAYHTHAGKAHFRPSPKKYPKELKECFVLYRCVEGEGCVTTTTGEFVLQSSDIVIVRDIEKLSLKTTGEHWRYYSVFFYSQGFSMPVNGIYSVPIAVGEEETLKKIISLLQRADFLSSAKANAMFQTILCDTLLKIDAKNDRSPYAEIMKKTARYIRENLTKNLSVEELAQMCFFSKNHFCNVFKEYFKMTPKAFIIKAKLEKACLLLSDTNLSVAEIAAELTFYSPAHFASVFKSHFNATPIEYRKKR